MASLNGFETSVTTFDDLDTGLAGRRERVKRPSFQRTNICEKIWFSKMLCSFSSIPQSDESTSRSIQISPRMTTGNWDLE